MKRGDEMTASPALTAEASSCSIMPVAQDIHSSVLRQISGTDLPAIRVNGIDISLFPCCATVFARHAKPFAGAQDESITLWVW